MAVFAFTDASVWASFPITFQIINTFSILMETYQRNNVLVNKNIHISLKRKKNILTEAYQEQLVTHCQIQVILMLCS